MNCTKRCCLVDDMREELLKMLDIEFPNKKEYKISYVSTNKEQINIHIECESLKATTLKKIEDLHYKVENTSVQPYMGISLAVVPNEIWFKWVENHYGKLTKEDKNVKSQDVTIPQKEILACVSNIELLLSMR